MKLLLVPWGRGLGHITRCLAIANFFLRDQDNEVFVITNKSHKNMVNKAGCNIIAYPVAFTSISPWENWDEFNFSKASVINDCEVLDRINPDAVITDVRWSMVLACEKKKTLCYSIIQYNMCPGYIYPGEVSYDFWDSKLNATNDVISYFNLAKISDVRDIFFRHQVFIPSIPEFDVIEEHLTHSISFVGPLLHNDKRVEEVDFNNNKPIIFIYGIIREQEDFNAIVHLYMNENIHIVITALPDNIEITATEAMQNITVIDFIDISILDKCSVALIHGGHGSCIKYGAPTIIVADPAETERLLNGKQLEKMGIGELIPYGGDWNLVYKRSKLIANDLTVKTNTRKWKEVMNRTRGGEIIYNKVMADLLII